MDERQQLLADFREEAKKHLVDLETGLLQLQKNLSEEGTAQNIFLAVHSIKGTASLFGLEDIVALAKAMEKIARGIKEGTFTPNSVMVEVLFDASNTLKGMLADMGTGTLHDVSAQLTALANLVSNREAGQVIQQFQLLQGKKSSAGEGLPDDCCLISSEAAKTLPGVEMLRPGCAVGGKKLYVLEASGLRQGLADQMENFGYMVQQFSCVTDLQRAIITDPPSAAIIDNELWQQSEKAFPTSIPVVALSSYGDISTRLQATRAGAEGFCTKPPMPITDLIGKLDKLTSREQPEPYRVFIVDDNPVTANYFATVLSRAGMVTFTTSHSKTVLKELPEFYPDLILMDLYMPEYTGMELAQVIRQFDEYVSIPIVYLSSESSTDVQLEAMSYGGDDFLNKSISDEHLIAAVVNRMERYRILRSNMIRDALTGLLNHSIFKERLVTELVRQKRTGNSVSVAMIDLDFFKAVNDNYGHHAGDQVLCVLSRLLKNRLRRSDIIGRYGGEEFGVIMPDTGGATAKKVMEDVRQRFGQILHTAGNHEFQVTLSCGVAASSGELSYIQMINQADKALYTAKQKGRNKVVLGSKSKK